MDYFVYNCDNVIVTNCSYYHSALCNSLASHNGGGVGIVYNGYTQYSNTGYTLELSHSNMTKCCNYQYAEEDSKNLEEVYGWQTHSGIWFSNSALVAHLVLSQNKAKFEVEA